MLFYADVLENHMDDINAIVSESRITQIAVYYYNQDEFID